MEILTHLFENAHYSFVSALILGLMTAISPCPLATNISAIGFIGRDINNRKTVFVNGLVYTLGRSASYFALALVLYLGADQLNVSMLFQGWGEKLLGPLLVVIGLFMLDVVTFNFPSFSKLTGQLGSKSGLSYWRTFLLGVVFALAFCPYSGVLFFGMLIPMSIASADGLYLPIVFAVATALPVIVFAWVLAFAMGNVGRLFQRLKVFETWFRRVVAIVFIGVGIYYIVLFFL